MPIFVFSLTEKVDALAEKLVNDALIPAFRKLHPEKSGWNLSLVNVGATNMAETATDSKDGAGRDIGRMFRRQVDVLKEWKIEDRDVAPSEDEDGFRSTVSLKSVEVEEQEYPHHGSGAALRSTQDGAIDDTAWDSEEDASDFGEACSICRAVIPPFAMVAHERFHTMPD